MPNDTKTVAAYAAGASLVAIATFYVFGPTFFIDGENSYNTSDGRKRTIIGLVNNANDCFINSVLQALAGLGDLRLYLIKELHRRELEDKSIYAIPPAVLKKGETAEKVVNLQRGPVTKALKDMLDALNERPIYKKTISARPMIEALEKAFRTRISRNQQDAQEFLQIVLERLCDEYHAAEKARKRAAQEAIEDGEANKTDELVANPKEQPKSNISVASSHGFPFEGRIESQIQCQHCGFKTNPSATTFVSLTLNVPQKSSTSLDNCFDILLKSEEIDDFKCDRCRLRHALEWKQSLLKKVKTDKEGESLSGEISQIEEAIRDDPEKPPEGIELPDLAQAPKRKIRKSTRITVFPKVIAIHLSRSVFDPGSYSTKNLAKVSYTQRLRLGGLLNEKWYKLLGVVCHKGSHSSGHYESFRRNHLYPPFATPDAFAAYAAASKSGTPLPSATPSPHIDALKNAPNGSPLPDRSSTSLSSVSESLSSRPTSQPSTVTTTPSVPSTPLPPSNSQPPSQSQSSTSLNPNPDSNSPAAQPNTPIRRTDTNLTATTTASHPQITTQASKATDTSKFRPARRKKSSDRWWRISDDKIKEARTSDVLGMQREVYLLFYELEREGDDLTS